MKTQWDLPGFSLNVEPLWKNANGPKWEDTLGSRLATADLALQEKFRSGKIGFYDWPKQADPTEVERIRATAEKIRREFKGALCIGIGGSYLGPSATLDALRSPWEKNEFPIHWLSNADAAAVRDARYFCEQRKVATVIISKSGGTVETLAGFFHLSEILPDKGYVVITDPQKGELRRLAKANQWNSFEVPPNIGGRFSVLTAVGLFPCALGGIDPQALLRGASQMRAALEKFPPAENPAYLFAMASFLWDTERRCKIQYLMPYSSPLKGLAEWYVQLWAESLGKDSRGPTPVPALGTSDQHSVLQLFKEGPRDKVIGFLEVGESTKGQKIGKPSFEVAPDFQFLFPHSFGEVAAKASRATEQSLANSQVPTYRIRIPEVTAEALGAFFFFQELACALAGELYGVDAFDQPGVEEAKKLLRQSL